MRNMVKHGLGVAALAAILVAVPAQAACWSVPDADAAAARELDTMMMVSALRCRLTGNDFVAGYNSFVGHHRSALSEANTRIRGHFGGDEGAQDAYLTHVANRYGGGVRGMSCADVTALLGAADAQGASVQALAALARQAAIEPDISGQLCDARVAVR